MRRSWRALLCAALFCVLPALTGCTANTVQNYRESGGEITSIAFFGNKVEPENVAVIEEIISDFMVENPNIRVSYESLKGAEYYEALEKRMAAGKGDDVFMVDHDTVLALEAKGQLADLSGLSSIGNYTDEMLRQMKSGGQIIWVPTTVSVFGLYCNLDLLREHGQDVPENLGEWRAVCDYFVERGIAPVIANNDISLKTLAIGTSFYSMYQEDRQKEVFDRINRGEETLSAVLYEGFSLVEEFLDKGYVDAEKALVTKKTSDDLEEFVKGGAPFLLTGAWAAGRVDGMEPDFDFQVAPYPALEDGSFEVINPDTRLSVNADSGSLEAALKFVEYFTREDNIQKFADEQSSFSPLRGGSPSSVKEVQPLIADYQAGRTVIGSDGLLDLPIWELTAEASKSLLSGEPLDSVMEQLDRQAAEKAGAP